jgi:outer membrane receptor protein involved in Fe transport
MVLQNKSNTKKIRYAVLLGSVSAVAIVSLGAQSASGQTATESGKTSVASDTTEVIVTANRRSETVQKANQSITAITGAQLQASGIASLEQLGGQVPGISMKNYGPGQTEYAMRGMSSSGGSSPTVGFYLDDVALTPPSGSDVNKPAVSPSLYDLNRVEVLRGPQGTLYGSSSMGGTIRLITNQPNTSSFDASAQVIGSETKGGGGNYGVSGMVNIPLIDHKLALRIVGTENYSSGWIDRVYLANFPQPTNGGVTRGDVLSASPTAVHEDANWTRTHGLRASLLWTPTDNLTVSPTIIYQKLNQGGQNVIDQPPGAHSKAHFQPVDVAEPSADEFELVTLPITYKFGGVKFDSITGYYHRIASLTEDNNENIQDYFVTHGLPVTFSQVGEATVQNSSFDSQFTQEFRLSSNGDGPFQWLAGVYYQDFNSRFVIKMNQANAFVTSVFGTNDWYYSNGFQNIKQTAAFGELSYKFDDFKVTGGLRYYSYDTPFNLYTYGIFSTGTGPAGAATTTGRTSASGFLPRLNLSYEPSSNLTLYGQIAKGFRPGSALAPAPVACGSLPNSYRPDSLWSYEIGEKARVFDRRLTVNSSIYYENWSDIQQALQDNACGYVYTGNGGSAHIYGGELEATLRLTSEITLATNFGYTDAKLATVTPDAAAAGFHVGQRVQAVPKWTDTTSLVYTHRINDDYNLVYRASLEYVDSQEVAIYGTGTVPSHEFVNMRLGFASTTRVSAWLYANNLTNASTPLGLVKAISVQIPSVVRALAPQPRTIGVELDYAF